MGISGAADKKALQPGARQAAREGMKEKREAKHFTEELAAGTDNAYGWTWAQVVKEYLRCGYNAPDSNPDIVVNGETYKTLKRPKVTVFYDAAGDTLFDVTNERLEKEYGWLMNNEAGAENEDYGGESEDAAEDEDDGMGEEEEGTETGETPETERAQDEEEDVTDNVIPMGTASLKEIVTGLPTPTAEEIAAAREENAKPVKQRAKEKLEKERKSAKDSVFADPIIEYLLKRCEEDDGIAQDVVQEHKTWQKCFDYIFSQARKQSKGNCAAVRDDVVYEWAEDYYHKDDKAEADKKAKEDAERKKRQAEAAKEAPKAKVEKKAPAPAKLKAKPAAEEPKQKPKLEKPKRNSRDMEGQMDMFSLMGM